MIWQNTAHVGCGVTPPRGGGTEVLVCRYSPRGNNYGYCSTITGCHNLPYPGLAAPVLGLQTAIGEMNGKDVDSLIKDHLS